MKLIKLTEYQQEELSFVHPEGLVSDHCAFIPESEYLLWDKIFHRLTTDLFKHCNVSSRDMEILRLPIFHWVSKFTLDGGATPGSFLIPKAFKLGFLCEGAYKDFGYNLQLIHYLNTFYQTFGYSQYEVREWEDFTKYPYDDYLGYMAWDEDDCSPSLGDRFMPMVFPYCIRNVHMDIDIKFPKLFFKERLFKCVVPSFLYFDNATYQNTLNQLNKNGLLLPSLGFKPMKLENLTEFRSPQWARFVEFKHQQPIIKQANKSGSYILVSKGDHKTYSWQDVQNSPMLKLALEMEEEWLWQEACISPFPDLNLCWTPCLHYPWIVNRKTGRWVPAFVIKGA